MNEVIIAGFVLAGMLFFYIAKEIQTLDHRIIDLEDDKNGTNRVIDSIANEK